MRLQALALLPAVVLASACIENPAPGNDREAALDPAAPPAEVATAGEALDGVAPGLVYPQIMTDADLRAAPDVGGSCAFRFTRVGFPALVYGSTTGVVKLNDKLVPLPASGAGAYGEGGVRVTVRPLEDRDGEEQFSAELVLRLQGSPNEIGFHGWGECSSGAVRTSASAPTGAGLRGDASPG
jgi:hypothetical protein